MTTDIYGNLSRRCWSLRQSGRVIGHAASAALADVTLHASEPARQRYLRTRHRTVHAWARGRLVDAARPADAVRLSYWPASGPAFLAAGMPVRKARLAWFEVDGSAWAAGGEDAPILDTLRPTH
ncbi:hypothetical protein ACRAWG_32680 [Methylobacterium sp. P31]